jgi:hypothetical protein
MLKIKTKHSDRDAYLESFAPSTFKVLQTQEQRSRPGSAIARVVPGWDTLYCTPSVELWQHDLFEVIRVCQYKSETCISARATAFRARSVSTIYAVRKGNLWAYL